jgi:cellulose synthase/poly-beta-1,6-N-acetylglucosamine synthase-like glycosyltransferase
MFNIPLFNKPTLKGRVSILIPTAFDSRYIIELCLKSIQRNTDYPDYQVIVCDNHTDESTHNYLTELEQKDEIRLVKTTDIERPKDDLVRAVDTDYYVLMHDDIMIKKRDWLTKRMLFMNKDPRNAIIGTIAYNFGNKEIKRFFPLGLLVKTEVSCQLDLKWGKQQNFDTGSLAYKKFFSQNEFKFIPYRVSRDIHHFSSMGWTKRKILIEGSSPYLEEEIKKREMKILKIRNILADNTY